MLNHHFIGLTSLTLIGFVLSGCATVTAKRGGDGIPFYPPKPYLVVTKNIPTAPTKIVEITTTKPDGTKVVEKSTEQPPSASASKSVYSYQILYLPDLKNRYGLKIEAGLGTATADIVLADGWKFTSLKASVDSKTAENLTALSGLVGALAPASDDPKDEVTLVIYEILIDSKDEIAFKAVFKGTPFKTGP